MDLIAKVLKKSIALKLIKSPISLTKFIKICDSVRVSITMDFILYQGMHYYVNDETCQ